MALLGSEPVRGGTRLFFVAGGRLRHRLGAHEQRNAALRTLLGAPDGVWPRRWQGAWSSSGSWRSG